MPERDPDTALCDEAQAVYDHRFFEARDAGLTRLEARKFAESTTDVGLLRQLVRDGCPAITIARIVN